MVISVEIEKTFGKTQHLFKIMTYSTQEIERSSLYDHLKKTSNNHHPQIVQIQTQKRILSNFRGTLLKAFIIRLRMSYGCLLSPFTISGNHHKP